MSGISGDGTVDSADIRYIEETHDQVHGLYAAHRAGRLVRDDELDGALRMTREQLLAISLDRSTYPIPAELRDAACAEIVEMCGLAVGRGPDRRPAEELRSVASPGVVASATLLDEWPGADTTAFPATDDPAHAPDWAPPDPSSQMLEFPPPPGASTGPWAAPSGPGVPLPPPGPNRGTGGRWRLGDRRKTVARVALSVLSLLLVLAIAIPVYRGATRHHAATVPPTTVVRTVPTTVAKAPVAATPQAVRAHFAHFTATFPSKPVERTSTVAGKTASYFAASRSGPFEVAEIDSPVALPSAQIPSDLDQLVRGFLSSYGGQVITQPHATTFRTYRAYSAVVSKGALHMEVVGFAESGTRLYMILGPVAQLPTFEKSLLLTS